MRIGIITCNNAENYGARLQAYALRRYLCLQGHEAMVIDYCSDDQLFGTRQWYWPGASVKLWAKLLLRYDERRREIAKHRALEAFSVARLGLTRRYGSLEQLRAEPPQCDIYIAGSDQIWNTNFSTGRDPAFYLDFGAPDVRRLSYAASFAIASLPIEYRDSIARRIGRLDAVSVRESSAVDIVRGLGLSATQVCDPAFLLEGSQWREVMEPLDMGGRPYLLVYDFENSPELKAVARRAARLRGLSICSVSTARLGYADIEMGTCTPGQFVWLLAHAGCVVSNSLHGSIFAMIFGVDYYIVNRVDGLNVRMRDMLEHYGLPERTVTSDVDDDMLVTHIDYNKVRERLDADIEASRQWLTVNCRQG